MASRKKPSSSIPPSGAGVEDSCINASRQTAALLLPPLFPFQEKFLRRTELELVVISATQIGKTFACAVWLLYWLWTHPRKLGWWCAPTLEQAREGYNALVELNEICLQACGRAFIVRAVESKMRIYLRNGSRVECRSWEKRENLRGRTVDAMVVDEAGMLDSASRAILSTRRSATLGPIRYIGNPGPVLGEFWNLCQQAQDEANAGRMGFIHWSWRDRWLALKGEHPDGPTHSFLRDVEAAARYLNFIESERKDLSAFEFDQQYEGKFPTPPGALFAEWLDRAMVLDPDPEPHPGHPYVMGWDIGQQSGWTRGVPLCLKCWSVQHVSSIRGEAYPTIEAFIASESRRFNHASAVIEKNGPGGPVFDHVMTLYDKVQGWWTDNKSKRTAALAVNRDGGGGKLRFADLPVLRSEMTVFKSHQQPSTGTWTFVSPAKKEGHGDAVSALLIAVGSATSGAEAFLRLLQEEIDRNQTPPS